MNKATQFFLMLALLFTGAHARIRHPKKINELRTLLNLPEVSESDAAAPVSQAPQTIQPMEQSQAMAPAMQQNTTPIVEQTTPAVQPDQMVEQPVIQQTQVTEIPLSEAEREVELVEVPLQAQAPLQPVEEQAIQAVEQIPGAVPERISEPVQEEQQPALPQPVIQDKVIDESITRLLQEGNEGFNEQQRKKAVIDLLNKGISYLQTHSLNQSFDAFTHSKDFIVGELYLFVLDNKGNVYAHGGQEQLVWQNLWNFTDQFKTPIIQNLIKKAIEDPGWISYFWHGSTKVSYVKTIVKEGKTFIIGSGYWPHSKSEQVVGLVRGAVGLFKELVTKQNFPVEEAFSSYSYPMGRFVLGDLYIYVLDFQGTIFAQGERPGLIGTNAWNYQDSQGKYVNQEIIKKLQNVAPGTGVWVKYISKNAPKLAYAEEVRDNTGKRYFIACGYYPTSTRDKVVELVKKGYDYLKRQGKSRAVEAFSSKRDDSFRYGDLTLSVFTLDGTVVANGDNPETIGMNFFNARDEDGILYIQELIRRAQEGGGWINFQVKNSFQSAYCEMVELGLEKLVVTSGLFPISKQETALLMVRSAASLLRTQPEVEALRVFSNINLNFIRGDLFVTVYDSNGIVLVSGDEYEDVLKNMMEAKDDNGKPYVRLMINAVKRGPAKISYKIQGANRVDFAEQVQKDGKTYIVTVGYFI